MKIESKFCPCGCKSIYILVGDSLSWLKEEKNCQIRKDDEEMLERGLKAFRKAGFILGPG